MRARSSFDCVGSKMNGLWAGPRKLPAMALPMWWSILPRVAKVGRSAGPGRSFDTTLPYIGYWSVPLGRRGLPVSQYIGARAWSPGLFSVVTERMTVYLFAIFARLGISSQTSRPETLERIGLNSPR